MSNRIRVRVQKVLLVFGIAAICLMSLDALTSKVVPKADATCLGRTDCTPESPAVNCCNVPLEAHQFANICDAQAACFYKCADAPDYPPICQIYN
ncbi:MAG TPA: hypothetical protein VFV19_17055 [Candidatus Polarisedimenticolaceae bacterium]|nr:hypothetical protein [Candidatus Polarisedimenticolaceae bacterium]